MSRKVTKANITTIDEKGHVRHHTETDSSINWKKVGEAMGPPVAIAPSKSKKKV